MSATTLAKSKKKMEADGYHVEIVEHWVPVIMVRRDMFTFLDLFCIHKETGDIVGVQSTSASNISSRINKITESPLLPIVRKAGIGVIVHGWRKVKNRWECRAEDLS